MPNFRRLYAISIHKIKQFPWSTFISKVRQSRNHFFKPFFFQKTNEWIQLYTYETSGWLVFVHFWKKLKTSKRHSEFNWPLLINSSPEFCTHECKDSTTHLTLVHNTASKIAVQDHKGKIEMSSQSTKSDA